MFFTALQSMYHAVEPLLWQSVLFGVSFIAIVAVIVFIVKGSQLLVNPGEQFNITKTIGLVGTVYQQINAYTPGKIHVVVDGVTRELLALPLNNVFIPSFRLVKIVKTLDHEMVVVQEINS